MGLTELPGGPSLLDKDGAAFVFSQQETKHDSAKNSGPKLWSMDARRNNGGIRYKDEMQLQQFFAAYSTIESKRPAALIS